MKIFLLDNFDSFTYNLVDYLLREGAEVEVKRNNEHIPDLSGFDGIVLSPGPSRPESSGNLLPLIEAYHNQLPILGICLGFQAIGEFFGARLIRLPEPVHGKSSEIVCSRHPMYSGIPERHQVARYHSLCLENLPEELELTSETRTKIPMGIAHREWPIWAVQYHPEAVLSEYGLVFIRNWINSLNK
ncbi:MAG: aminodeoxychorismate/anthranilate synthase component II [Bacteroidetes bacterium]|nr:aminodeoxychorismate/anthranilate synthase component II [Bacteroidota bacterium]